MHRASPTHLIAIDLAATSSGCATLRHPTSAACKCHHQWHAMHKPHAPQPCVLQLPMTPNERRLASATTNGTSTACPAQAPCAPALCSAAPHDAQRALPCKCHHQHVHATPHTSPRAAAPHDQHQHQRPQHQAAGVSQHHHCRPSTTPC
jgi:hypothetical protein